MLTAALRHTLERAFERQRAELTRIEDAHQRLLKPVHNEFYDRWRDAVTRTVRRGQRQGVFRGDLDVDWVTRRLTALTDGAAIQVLTGAAGMTVTVMRELLVEFVERELVPPRPTR